MNNIPARTQCQRRMLAQKQLITAMASRLD